MALAWHNEVRIERHAGEGLIVTGAGGRSGAIPKDASNLVVRALEMVIGELPPLQMNQLLAIPMGKGFGSSAAAVVAGLVAGRALGKTSHTDGDLLELAVRLEGHADNVAPCLFGGITVSTADHTVRLDPPQAIMP